MTKSSWVDVRPSARTRLRVFCFPYAGGNANGFASWRRLAPRGVEICPVRLPGRDGRDDAASEDFAALLDATYAGLEPFLDRPFAFFGHSMGALLAFECARRAAQSGREPVALIPSACAAPDLVSPSGLAATDETVAAYMASQGTDLSLFSADDRAWVVRLMAADIRVCDSYVYSPGEPLPCPVMALGGLKDDSVSRDELLGWRRQSAGDFSLEFVASDHLFLRSHPQQTFRLVARYLAAGSSR